MGIPCGFPVTDTVQRRLYMKGKWKPFIPSCVNMLLTTHKATVYTQSPETDFVMSGTLVGRMAMVYFNP
jgi:hypothetical protein